MILRNPFKILLKICDNSYTNTLYTILKIEELNIYVDIAIISQNHCSKCYSYVHSILGNK